MSFISLFVIYEWNDDKMGSERPDGVHYVFMAQNNQGIFPTLVEEDALSYPQTANGTCDAMLVEALRALNERIEELERENIMIRAEIMRSGICL